MFGKALIVSLVPVGTALLAGALLPFQAASNAAVGRALGHPLWGALTSLVVSLVAVATALVVLKVPAPAFASALRGPGWLWVGGLLGAFYVGAAATLAPRLGAGGFLACIVAGQMAAALWADHSGLMGLPVKPASFARLAGVVLILGGVLLVQFAGTPAASRAP